MIEEFTQETSISRINTLHPKLVKPAMDIYTQCISDGFPIHIVCGKRTEEEQAVIYKYGRTIPGDILTPNRPGYSPHNYGLALDFCLYYAKQMQTWEDASKVKHWRWIWLKILKRFEEAGWTVGWRKPYKYEPGHVENLLGKSMGEWYTEQHGKNRSNWNQYL